MPNPLQRPSRRLLLPALLAAAAAVAQPVAAPPLDEAYGDAFVHYQPYWIRPRPAQSTKGLASPPTSAPADAPGEQVVDVDWLRRNYARLETAAINHPSAANLAAFLYTKRITVDKAQRYSEAYMQATQEDPLLDENNRIPYASLGAQSIRNADYLAQQQAARELAALGGSLLFVDSSCRFCALQIPVLQALKNNFQLEFLLISIDGKVPAGYQGPFVTDNGLFAKLGLRLTPSLVFVPRPRAYRGATDPNQYLIISQGFYTQDEMLKQLAFAAHQRRLLSAQTMADLAVWDRGVATSADLDRLKLDASRPESFKPRLQALLLKQYR